MNPKKDRLPDSVHIAIKKISDKICDSADNIQFITIRKDVITDALINVYWQIKPYTLRDKLNTLYRSMEKIFLQAHIRYSKTHLMYCMDRNRNNLRNLRSDTAYSKTSVWPILLNDIDFILEPDLLNEIAEIICKARFSCDTDRETAYDLILQSIFNIERKLYIYIPIQSFTIERTNCEE